MREEPTGPPRRGRRLLLALCGLLGGLAAQPARPDSFYENNRSYFFGTGDVRCAGGAVDAPTGALLLRFELPRLPGRVHPQIALYFNSQDGTVGPLGTGTSTSLDWKLYQPPYSGNDFDLIAPGHRRYHFFYGYDSWLAQYVWKDTRDPEMLGAYFSRAAGEYGLTCTLHFKNADQFKFGYYGDLTRMLDRFGNFVDVNAGGFPSTITFGGTWYPRVDFTYSGGKLASLTYTYSTTNPPARAWNFSYDVNGRLSTMTNPLGGVTRFTWTTYTRSDGMVLPLVSTITDARNNTALSALYDTSGRVTRLTAADGGATNIAYSAGIGVDGTTTVTDPRLNTASWSYTWPAPPSGQTAKYGYWLTSETDALGRTTQLARLITGSNLVSRITDFRGRVSTLNWDTDKGNLTSVTKPTADGLTATSTAGYEPDCNQCTAATDPLGHTANATVDATTKNIIRITDPLVNATWFGYDATTGDLTSVTNAVNHIRYLTYDGLGDLTRLALGPTTLATATFDSASRRTSATDANGKTTNYAYDALDRLISASRVVGGQTLATTFEYDANGNRTALVDPKGQRWEWSYDSMNRMTQDKNPLLQTRSYSYDQNSNLTTFTDRLGQQWVLTYGTGDRIATKTFKRADTSVESTVTHTYDPTTKLLTSVNDSLYGTTSWGYDSIDRVISETKPDGSVLQITLDPKVNLRKALQVPGQGPVTYAYDSDNNLSDIAQNAQNIHLWRDALGRKTQMVLPNGVTTQWSYDDRDFLQTIYALKGGVNFDGHLYTRDNTGTIVREDVNGQAWMYGYDDLYRLTSASVLGTTYAWTYDQVGNRLTQTANGVTTTYAYNAANRLTTVNGQTVSHDANGNLTGFGGDIYSWDVRGRLASLLHAGTNSQYFYGPDNLRVKKIAGATTTTYLLDGADVVKETTGGVATDLYRLPAVDQVLKRGNSWYTPDGLGSTATLTDGSGTVTQRYLYNPFGQAAPTPSPGDGQPIRFTGREDDGTGLLYYRQRYYLPDWGRFISEDPLGFVAGVNQYAYCGNNPVNHTDSTGEMFDNRIFDPVYERMSGGSGPSVFDGPGGQLLMAIGMTPAGGRMAIGEALEVVEAPAESFAPAEPASGGGSGTPAAAPEPPSGGGEGSASGGDVILWRSGTPSPSNLRVRPGEEGLSFRDSLSDPLNDSPVFTKDEYFGVNAGSLPPGSVVFDNNPPGHVTVAGVEPEVLKGAVVVRGKFPKQFPPGWLGYPLEPR
jgi:RHS repeat-associated protein